MRGRVIDRTPVQKYHKKEKLQTKNIHWIQKDDLSINLLKYLRITENLNELYSVAVILRCPSFKEEHALL